MATDFSPWLLVAACLVAQGFFSGSEIALVSVSRIRLKHRAEKGSKTARLIEQSLRNPETLLGTTLLGTNLCAFTANTLATLLVVRAMGERYAWVTIPLMWPILLLFGEMIPKAFYQEKAEALTPLLIYPLRALSLVLSPAVWLISSSARLLLRSFGLATGESKRLLTREDLCSLAEQYGQAAAADPMEEKILRRVLEFSEKTAKEAMRPLLDVVALEVDSDFARVKETVLRHPYTRYPIYDKRIDNIVGILHIYDLLVLDSEGKPLAQLLRPALFAAEHFPVDKLLLDMQADGQPMAVIVDEYGAAVGVLTMEDIMEEVVGGMQDEFGRRQALYRQLSPKAWLIHARAEIELVEELLAIRLPRHDFETLGGFLLQAMGKIPEVGEKFRYQGVEFRITKANERAVQEVQVNLP